MPVDRNYLNEWLQIAKFDWIRIYWHLEDYGDYSGAGFFLQQSVEKHLKAFLLSKNWKLRKTHDLELLLNYALEYHPDWENYRFLCNRLKLFYMQDRYPFTALVHLKDSEVRECLHEAKPWLEAIRQELHADDLSVEE